MAKNSYLEAAIEQRAAKTAVLQQISNGAATDGRPLTDDERKTFDELTAECKRLDAEIARQMENDEAVAKFTKLVGARQEKAEELDRAYREAGQEPEKVESRSAFDYGRAFVESDAFKNFSGYGTSGRVEGPGVASPEFRAAITTQSFPQLQTPATFTPAEPADRNEFLSLIGREVVGSGAFTFMQWGPVSEASEVAEGQLKPEATLALTEGAGTLLTYAHYKAITRQALEDTPRIQAIIQGRLLQGVRNKLNSVATQAFADAADVEDVYHPDSLLAAIRGGMATVEDNGYDVQGVLMNPLDAADLDLEVMAGTVNGPVRIGSVFGRPVATSKAVARGTAGVGDFRTAMTWFDRNVLASYLTDSHGDFFLRNQLVMLAETRARIMVTEAAAVVKVHKGTDPSA